MKKIDLVGCSDQSWEDATRRAVTQAVQAGGSCNSVQVKRFEATVTDGMVSQFCVRLEASEAVVSRGPCRPARILVADDLEPIQRIARSILEGAGHAVDTAYDGAETLAQVRSRPYDLILMDIEMPTMGGIASTKAIRALGGPASATPILAMTVNVLPEHVRAYRAAGMNDYVVKPLTQKDFLRKLNEWLPEAKVSKQPADVAERAVPFFDQTAFESLQTMMGKDQVSAWIEKFLQQLETTFPTAAAGTPGREQLSRDAHTLVSHAALLGFLELSQRCSELEGACKSGGDMDPPIRRVRAAARAAGSRAREAMNG